MPQLSPARFISRPFLKAAATTPRPAASRPSTDSPSRRAAELGHAAAIASALYFKAVLESRRDDVSSTRLAVEPLLALTEEHNLKTYADVCRVFANWVCGRGVDPEQGDLWD